MNKKFIVFFILLIGFTYLIFYSGLDMHERAHGSICEAFGGSPEYNYTLYKATTYCDNLTFDSLKGKIAYTKLQQENEIYTYNLLDIKGFIGLMFASVVMITYILFDISNNIKFYLRNNHRRVENVSNKKDR